ncbi:RNA polymerase sigma-70 factor, ECF subfamily [Planctomicrobium piriforme]|uniref:RNA polymerase sigma-70 factor, ECF subfamily n=2 Tax=Planctomicrobium piriforme TaxID=1576369 RepID=A0A1I3RUX9_9PLAN|nr:RNA polymerase sigma-70 factor, ECF subfamily [Planctomicrobium piriforme]
MLTSADTQERYQGFLREYARERTKLFRYIFSLLPNHADAEDVFQRCSIVLWQKFSEFDARRSFLAWACGVAFNEVCYFLRSTNRGQLKFDSELLEKLSDDRVSELGSTDQILVQLADCLKLLPRRDRELVRVAYGKSGTLREFAESTNQAPQTLYNNLGRIRRQLQTCVRRKLAVE